MTPKPPSDTIIYAYAFGISFAVTVVTYLLRGFEIVAFIPGGVILFLILLSIGTGLLYGVQKTRRY